MAEVMLGLWDWTVWVVVGFSTIMMVIGPLTGYLPQYIEILKSRNSEGFSTRVCLILLTCNVLRVYFWFGKRFDMILLYQSFVMIFAQFLLLELCIRMRNSGKTPIWIMEKRQPRYLSLDVQDLRGNFWKWDDFGSYALAIGLFAVLTGFVTMPLLSQGWYVELLGFFANGIEAVLGVPQMISNNKRKSTEGLSIFLIISWLLGDSFKTVYFILGSAPLQFTMCGVTQIVVDCIILYQFRIYRHDRKTAV